MVISATDHEVPTEKVEIEWDKCGNDWCGTDGTWSSSYS